MLLGPRRREQEISPRRLEREPRIQRDRHQRRRPGFGNGGRDGNRRRGTAELPLPGEEVGAVGVALSFDPVELPGFERFVVEVQLGEFFAGGGEGLEVGASGMRGSSRLRLSPRVQLT